MELRDRREGPPLTELVKDLRDESLMLVRQELTLARKELMEKATELSNTGISLGAGGAILYAGALFMLLGAARALDLGLVAMGAPAGWAMVLSPLLVGGLAALIGYGMVKRAKQDLSVVKLVPERTIRTLKEDKEWAARRVR